MSETRRWRANHIQELRMKACLSQTALAAKIGVNQSMISMYETGENVPSLPTAFRLADALDCTVQELYPFGLS